MNSRNVETYLVLAGVHLNYLICLQQLRRTEKWERTWLQPSEEWKEWNEEEQKTEVCHLNVVKQTW